MTRRSVLLAAGVCVALPRSSAGSTFSIARELRRMVGFYVLAADDVRQSWRSETGERFTQLRQSGVFKHVGLSGFVDPPAFTQAIVFVKPVAPELARQFPGLSARAYYDYRLLIDGEFYRVTAFD